MEKFDLENFPTSESAKKMLSYVSDGFYDKSYVGKWLFQVMGLEYDTALKIAEDLPAQFFPETATWGLMYHEIKWGLPVRLNLSYEDRRKLIYRKRDCRAPMTPYRMEEYLKKEIDFEVYVADCHDPGAFGNIAAHPNIFRVTFVGEGTLDIKNVREILKKIKQSHTTYIIEDMVLTNINSKDLENVEFIHMDVQAFFYYFKRILNGGWLLDGSVSLGQIPICEIDMGISIGTIRAVRKEKADFCSLGIFAALPRVSVENQYSMENGCKFDLSGLQDVGMKDTGVTIPVRVETGAGADSVTIEKDLWRLDGQFRMDGSRILDAETREERL